MMVPPRKRPGARLQREHRPRLRMGKSRTVFGHFASTNVNARAACKSRMPSADAMSVKSVIGGLRLPFVLGSGTIGLTGGCRTRSHVAGRRTRCLLHMPELDANF